MTHIHKPKVVIASILRPVDDHRMYEKLGRTIADLHVCEVHIIGYCSHRRVREQNIVFHALYHFPRMSVERILAPLPFLRKLVQLRPEVVIVNSPENLIVSIVYKILFGKRIFYDVLENYQANIWFANTFPVFVRRLLGGIVRLIEWVSRPFITEFWLAEQVYAQELPFVKGKYRFIENRYIRTTDVIVKPRRAGRRLLYSGTIGESYGVFDAVALVKRLHAADPHFTLTIIGYAAQASVRNQLYDAVAGLDYIELMGIDTLVPHNEIIRQFQKADIALLPYQVNEATKGRVPTKYYEYIVHSLPFLMSNNPFWEELARPYSTGVGFIDFPNVTVDDCIEVINRLDWYYVSNISLDTTYYTNIFSNLTEHFC